MYVCIDAVRVSERSSCVCSSCTLVSSPRSTEKVEVVIDRSETEKKGARKEKCVESVVFFFVVVTLPKPVRKTLTPHLIIITTTKSIIMSAA